MPSRKQKMRLGVGAKCTVKTKYMHPKKEINAAYPNRINSDEMNELIVVKTAKHIVNRKMQTCVFFRHAHPQLENTEIYCTKRWVTVNQEGAEEHLFQFEDEPRPAVEESTTGGDVEIPSNMRGVREDIQEVLGLGLNVDDDTQPAPENIPTNGAAEPAAVQARAKFNCWHGIDHRKKEGIRDVKPRLNDKEFENLGAYDPLAIFLYLFPVSFFKEHILKKTNENLRKNHKRETTFGEMLRWIGLWFFMSTTSGYATRQFWSVLEVSQWEGAPFRLNAYMSYERFAEIQQSIGYTTKNAPSYSDKFWEIRDLIVAWNQNMTEAFTTSWVSCLDESMSIWHSRFTCPGWTFVPRKPHPFGNEYHSICCGLSGIMFAIEMVEGRDRPSALPPDPTNAHGKTAGLLLRLCQTLYGTGKVVILDSGFCVLAALIALKTLGVYAGAVIKKRRYWPKYIFGDEIEKHMEDKDVGEADVACGELDGVKYNVFALKEPEFVMKLMATYGDLAPKPGQQQAFRQYEKDGQTVKKQFCYPPPIANHFWYRHAVDDHNNLRHMVPSLEGTWITTRWANRVFAFTLGITEVNTYLAMKFFKWSKMGVKPPTFHQFRRQLARKMIQNNFLIEEQGAHGYTREVKRMRRAEAHELVTAPVFAKKYLGNGQWKYGETQYNQLTCTNPGCKKKVRTYCSCSIGTWLCNSCHHNHFKYCISSDESSD